MVRVLSIGTGLLLALASAASAQDLSRFVVEPDAAYTTDFGDQYYGALCAGPGEYFAAWVDLRVGGANPAGYDLYAQRIRPDGSLAHRGSLKLLRDADRITTGVPAAAWSGQSYLTCWYEGPTLYAMRISPDAEVLDPEGFVVDQREGNQAWPAAAGDGQGQFLVVQAAGDSVYAQRIGADGSVLDPAPLIVSSGAGGLGYPKVAFGAGLYTIAWAQAPDQRIRACRVTPDGQVLDPGGFDVSGGGTDVDAQLDFDGQDFFVVWQRKHGTAWDLWGARVNPQGSLTSAPGLLLDGASFGAISGGQVAFNGADHLVTITTDEPVFSNSDVWALQVSRSGVPSDPFPVCTQSQRSQVAYGVASVADQYFMLWEGNYVRGVYYTYDTQGARIDSAGRVLDAPQPLDVSTSAAWQIDSATSFDGQNYLCVFEDWREGKPTYQPDLYAVRITPSGQPLDTAAFPVAKSLGRPQGFPDAVFGLGQHAIVYENAGAVSEVRMVRVLPDGTVRDPGNGILVFANDPTADTFRPKIACNGQTYLVVWYDNYLASGEKPLQFALMRSDGTQQRGPVSIPGTDSADLAGFNAASNGDGYLVAWADLGRIRATRVSSAGVVLGTSTVQTTGNWITHSTQVAFNGESYLVAWAQRGSAGTTTYARLLSPAGTPLGATFVVAGPDAVPAEILPAGPELQVVLARSDGSPNGVIETQVQRIDSAGNLVGDPTVIFGGPRWEYYGASSFAAGPEGSALGVFSLWADDPYNAPREQAIPFEIGPSCAADFNGDGVVDTRDVMAFLNAWVAKDPAADFNGDGFVDSLDVLAFLNAWNAGC